MVHCAVVALHDEQLASIGAQSPVLVMQYVCVLSPVTWTHSVHFVPPEHVLHDGVGPHLASGPVPVLQNGSSQAEQPALALSCPHTAQFLIWLPAAGHVSERLQRGQEGRV